MRLGKYEIGDRTLGEGNFGKVKLARHVDSGQPFAVKILDRKRILALKIDDQIKREIGTLKLLRHPNVVRLHEVSASKTKIYMVLEYVNGGELFDKIELKGKLSESEGRKLLQQLIDAISYCHDKGVYHRDLKPENVLIDAKGSLPFEDRNLAVLYQKISKGVFSKPKGLSHGAQNLIHRILDPNPKTRINVEGIRADSWFRQDYSPVTPDDEEEDTRFDNMAIAVEELNEGDKHGNQAPTLINAFELIGMSSYFDLSGFFETEDVFERKIRFTSNYSPNNLFKKIEDIVTQMGFHVQKGHAKLKVMQQNRGSSSPKSPGSLSVAAEVLEICPSLYVVELSKSRGDSSLYRQLCSKLSGDLGLCESHQLLKPKPLISTSLV